MVALSRSPLLTTPIFTIIGKGWAFWFGKKLVFLNYKIYNKNL